MYNNSGFCLRAVFFSLLPRTLLTSTTQTFYFRQSFPFLSWLFGFPSQICVMIACGAAANWLAGEAFTPTQRRVSLVSWHHTWCFVLMFTYMCFCFGACATIIYRKLPESGYDLLRKAAPTCHRTIKIRWIVLCDNTLRVSQHFYVAAAQTAQEAY